jgi:transcriptional regulator with XRE-family HTH domain
MITARSIAEIQDFLKWHQKRLSMGDAIPTIKAIAERAGMSRQTLYAIMRGERTEFGQSSQIRLNLVINRLSAEPAYQHSMLMRVDLGSGAPRIRFGV